MTQTWRIVVALVVGFCIGTSGWAQTPATVFSKEIEAEVIPTPRTIAPGNVVKLMYTVFNYEETDQRVRLRVEAGPGWHVLESDFHDREWVVEALDTIDGEIHLVAAADAVVGQRQLVKIIVEVPGEPGAFVAQNYVTVVKRGGVKPGVASVSGSAMIAASELQSTPFDDAVPAGQFDLSSRLDGKGTLSFTYRHRVQDQLSNFRSLPEPTKITGSFRRAGWDLAFGNQVSSSGNAVSGPFVRGRGVMVKRLEGRLTGELALAQPTTFTGDAAGHLVRGGARLKAAWGGIGVLFSDFGRPAGGYSTIDPIVYTAVLNPDEQERLELERQMARQAASNRVQGFGVDAELRGGRTHHFTARSGALRLTSASGRTLTAPVGEAAYRFTARKANMGIRWREMPATLPGIYIPGDEVAADGSLQFWKDLRAAGNIFRSASDTLDGNFSSAYQGTSLGLGYARDGRRLDVRGNYRESRMTTAITIRRTGSVSFGLPIGPLSANGLVEFGEQERAARIEPLAFYRGDLRWQGERGLLSAGFGEQRNGSQPPMTRLDLLGSLAVREFELAGGVWFTRGSRAGGKPGGWTQVGLPVADELLVTFGVEYAPLTWNGQPTWRGTVGIRKKFTVALPFLAQVAP